MSEFEPLKLFISYSHQDEDKIRDFRKHLAPLRDNELISEWYDRKIIAGQDFQNKIDNNLEDADIICLCISANFLSSPECKREKVNAIKLKRKKGVTVIPIILSDCGWLDDKDISPLLALPTDGKFLSKFETPDAAWSNVYNGLKPVIQNELNIRQLKVSDQFTHFLQSTELLTNAHSEKETVLLDDIYVYPELTKYDDLREYPKRESSEKLLEGLCDYPQVLIAGENQSGKTSLCKKLYIELLKKNFVPIYLADKKGTFHVRLETKISKAFQEQYGSGTTLEKIDSERIVPIIDDFHFAKDKERLIQDLSTYRHQIVTVDEIFSLNFRHENTARLFKHFKIQEFSPSLRNRLIKKWVNLTDSDNRTPKYENSIYRDIDRTTELVNSALGKSIGGGIMPAYPFFIFMVISTYETFARPLDQEITSQGHCYQALIYIYLKKQEVKNDEIDTYLNFLTELAFYLYKESKLELSADDFDSFICAYKEKYNLPVEEEILISNLQKTNIFAPDNFNNYSFCYSYLYFFFVAKYLAEHLEDSKETSGTKDTIGSIINNLHKNDNAYIAVFLSHHSKNAFILEKIIAIASSLFENEVPSTLSRDELGFFDDQADFIAKAVLPGSAVMPEQERENDLVEQDRLEELKETRTIDKDDDELIRQLRRSIKTVEVMGMIIKTRAGSLERGKLESVFEEGMKVHLRVLQSFVGLFKKEEDQEEMVEYISSKIRLLEKDKGRPLSPKRLETLARIIFWNTNFVIVYGILEKIVHSLGSDKLTQIIETVCSKENTPAAFLVKQGILMWYKKNLQLDDITNRVQSDDFSKIAEYIVCHKIVDHCRFHVVGFKEKQKIEQRLKIPHQLLHTNDPM